MKNFNRSIKPICLNSKGGRNGIPGKQPSLKDRIYDSDGIAVAVTTKNFFMPLYLVRPKRKKVKTFLIAAVRGRKQNPSDIRYDQKLEVNKEGVCNTLTTVQKDNYVIEIETEEGDK